MNGHIPFDRKKHRMYPPSMGKKIREKLIADFGQTVGNQLWEKTRRKYAELLSDAPSMKGTPHAAGAYTAILFFAYYSVLPEKPSIETLQPFTNVLFMGSFNTMGKLFNMNRKPDLCLLAGIMKRVGKKDAASIRKNPDGFMNVQTPFDKENGIIRYKFTQCPNAEFAAGVMVAASIWSLIIPAIEQSEPMGTLAFLPAVIGFWGGMLFLLMLDHIIPHLHMNAEKAEGLKSTLSRTTMMVLAVTLHNIPEGMAVGVVYAGYLSGSAEITAGGALALSLGIAIQNFPEGAIISMPLHAQGRSKRKSFIDGVLSGAVEPVGAIGTILLAGVLIPVMPYLLSFAAGAMMYVVVEELIPEMSEGEHSNIGVIMFAVGFTLMMALDVGLG